MGFGAREALPNGTLWLGPFSAAQYRSDVHAAVYRCRAASTVGVILSRDMRLEAVMDVSWEVRVQPSHGMAGGAALLTCTAPAAARSHVTVTRWFKDGTVLAPLAAEAEGRYIIGGSRNDILVVRDARPDDASSYSCEAQHALTGDKRRSPPAMLAVSHATGSMAPRMLTVSEDEMVLQGGDIRLVCCALGSPPPTYSWFRHSNGRLSPVSNSIRISVSDQVLIIRRAQISDAGVWTCRAHNQYGEQRKDARLRVRARLVVSIHPQLQVKLVEVHTLRVFELVLFRAESAPAAVLVQQLLFVCEICHKVLRTGALGHCLAIPGHRGSRGDGTHAHPNHSRAEYRLDCQRLGFSRGDNREQKEVTSFLLDMFHEENYVLQ
ncbi:hypothetical protein O3G_MSEX011981 [Manduca sexta]|uniref:Hemolin n=1 Tax=Manduca sexta TaxID=7130 RepID=A0A922CWF5_MANSE|nr:hypothetical protein O3G_MSEX011981 [Manduca sexta]